MLPVAHIDLTYIKPLIRHQATKVDVHHHESGQLVLSATLEQPAGTAFFVVKAVLLNSFVEGEITLQEIYDLSPSVFIEICHMGETRLYMRYDIDIRLRGGAKKYNELEQIADKTTIDSNS